MSLPRVHFSPSNLQAAPVYSPAPSLITRVTEIALSSLRALSHSLKALRFTFFARLLRGGDAKLSTGLGVKDTFRLGFFLSQLREEAPPLCRSIERCLQDHWPTRLSPEKKVILLQAVAERAVSDEEGLFDATDALAPHLTQEEVDEVLRRYGRAGVDFNAQVFLSTKGPLLAVLSHTAFLRTKTLPSKERRLKEWNLVRALLKQNIADVNAYGLDNGMPPLETAAAAGILDIVQSLVEQGADLEHRDEEGKTPVMLAIERGHHATARFLEECAHKQK